MPRHRRLNIPGAIHHVITRGLNRQDIFLDDCDRNDFLGRTENDLSLLEDVRWSETKSRWLGRCFGVEEDNRPEVSPVRKEFQSGWNGDAKALHP